MGITRDWRHKRSASGGKRAHYRKKRKFELGRQAANTRIGAKRIHQVRVRGGNRKYRALRLDTGNFAWGSEAITRKSRIIEVSFHPSNNELVRTNTLTKMSVVQIDATPYRQYYESHYGKQLLHKSNAAQAKAETDQKPVTAAMKKKFAEREPTSKIEPAIEQQIINGRIYAVISSRPGQCGRADGYILEGTELAHYVKQISARRT